MLLPSLIAHVRTFVLIVPLDHHTRLLFIAKPEVQFIDTMTLVDFFVTVVTSLCVCVCVCVYVCVGVWRYFRRM